MTDINIPFSEFIFSYSKSGGPGGQNVNKVNSKVSLQWDMNNSEAISMEHKERFNKRFKNFMNVQGLVLITSDKYRSQKSNMEDAVQKLYALLKEVQYPPKKRKATKPKRSAVLKRLTSKRKDSEKKQLRRKDY